MTHRLLPLVPAILSIGLTACFGGGGDEPPVISPADPQVGQDCTTLPPVDDYNQMGPFSDVIRVNKQGPDQNYTVFRPGDSLGTNGFKHPIAVWGNGISTTPGWYENLLTMVASHGFVVVACNDIKAERPCLNDGLDWIESENGVGGAFQGMLDTEREFTIGYSWGGGAAIDTANRPDVKATVSLHGMPPRGETAFTDMHAPLLLFTSTGDGFVNAEEYVTPNYEASQVQTFYATLNDDEADHLYPIDGSGSAYEERGPMIAWMRYWGCGDQGAKPLFFGEDCELCATEPWAQEQRKFWTE